MIFGCVTSIMLGLCAIVIFNVNGPPSKVYVDSGCSDEVRIEAYQAWTEATIAYYENK